MRNLAFFALLALAVPALAQPRIDVRPRQPSPDEEIELHLSGFEEGCPPEFHLQRVENRVVVLRGFILRTCPPGPWTETVVLPPLPADPYRIEIRIGQPSHTDLDLHAVASIEVKPRQKTLSLHGGSFVASVRWHLPNGDAGDGFARALTSESGWFWFFSPDNLEVTLKVLDGRPVNGHWWIFLASMTDVELTVTVYDNRTGCLALPVTPPACPTWTYTNPPSVNANRLEIQAFPGEP